MVLADTLMALGIFGVVATVIAMSNKYVDGVKLGKNWALILVLSIFTIIISAVLMDLHNRGIIW